MKAKNTIFRRMKVTILLGIIFTWFAPAKEVAYIHGDVSADGDVPSGGKTAYDQMLLNDSGNTGLTMFKALVENEGYRISQYYDAELEITDEFLDGVDVVIFGLHQKMWAEVEKDRLREWLYRGGGMLIYSDSASGGRFNLVGINNPVGRNVTNNLIAEYGMEVTVDLGGGTRSYRADAGSGNPLIWDQPVFEGEGVSPVAVDPLGEAEVLIPLGSANRVSGNGNLNPGDWRTNIANPEWAAMAHRRYGSGNIIVTFDRQPMWNNGPGSDIDKRDNKEILRRLVRFLARDYGNSDEWRQFKLIPRSHPMQISWRRWKGGAGQTGVNYFSKNRRVLLQGSQSLLPSSWTVAPELFSEVGSPRSFDEETEIVTVEVQVPVTGPERMFFRTISLPAGEGGSGIVLDAGQARLVTQTGRVALEAEISGGEGHLNVLWEKVAGPGKVAFGNPTEAETTATFSAAGEYLLRVMASDGESSRFDEVTMTVVEPLNIVHAINCGSSSASVTGLNGVTYLSDRFYNASGSWSDNFLNNPVMGTEDDEVYNEARSNFSSYNLPVVNGDYLVYLQFSETWFTKANQRVFDLTLEGELVLDDFDLAALSSGKWVAQDRLFSVTVSDGMLSLEASSSVNHSLLNAIVVVQE